MLRSPAGTEYALSTELSTGETQWDGLRAYWRVPLRVPSSTRYTVRLYRSTDNLVTSNAWPVEVANPYHDFLLANFAPADMAFDERIGTLAEPDAPGLRFIRVLLGFGSGTQDGVGRPTHRVGNRERLMVKAVSGAFCCPLPLNCRPATGSVGNTPDRNRTCIYGFGGRHSIR